jgi:hypothetical protein
MKAIDFARVEASAAKVDEVIARRGDAAQVVRAADPLAALERFFVTQDQVDAIASTRMIWRDLIAASHLAVWSAPGNGGKTSLAKFAAGELACQGCRVLFFQEDASAGDLPALHAHAREHGYSLLNSTMADSSTEDQIRELRRMARSGDGSSLEGVVMFFDTLKKYTDLMSKGGARDFFKLMRALTQRGATIVLLGHTNKHHGMDGKVMFEGVGDVRNDVDELLYIEATEKDARGVVTLTMRPDKVRAAIKEQTFQLDTATMQVTALDHVVDVGAIERARRKRDEDRPLIDEVRRMLKPSGQNFTELRDRVMKATGLGKRPVTDVIERYMSDDLDDPRALWIETRLRVNNVRHVSLKPGSDA